MYGQYYGNQPGGKQPPTMPAGVKRPPQPLPTSLHEMQLNELRTQATGQRVEYSSGGPVVPAAPPGPTNVTWRGVYDSTLYLDSSYKNSTNGTQYNSMTFQVKPLNNGNDLSGITHIRVEPFYFPRLVTTTGFPDPFYLRRIMLLIDEIPSTAAVGTAAANQFHFEFAVGNVNSIAVELTPINDTIYFQVPIQTMSSITLRFLMPPQLTQITLPPDVITVFMMPPNPPPSVPPYTYGPNPNNLVKFAFTNATQWSAISNIDVASGTVRTVVPPFPTPFTTTALPTPVAEWGQNPQTNITAINNILGDPAGNFITAVGDPIAIPNTPGYYLPYGYFEMASFQESALAPYSLTINFPPIDPILYPGFIRNSVGIPITFQIRKNRIAMQMRFSSQQAQSTNGLIASHN